MMQSTNARGETMSQKFIRTYQAEVNSGRNQGIIAIAGFMHRHFAAMVSHHIPSSHVIAFSDKNEALQALECSTLIEKNIWKKAAVHGNTTDFYYSPVRAINAADYSGDYGFEKFEAEFALRSQVAVENPDSAALMGILQKVHPEIQFTRNNRFIVSAEISVVADEAGSLLESSLPLQPTVIANHGLKTLRFSGINLPPQAQLIASWDKKNMS